MEETTNTLKDSLKERLTNPFLGKFTLAWLICHWKIFYVTFFVDEDKLDTNRLEYISNYLKVENCKDFFIIYIIPLLLTAFFIWILPILSKIVFNVSEEHRKEKALKKKKTDDAIEKHIDKEVNRLNNELERLKEKFYELEGKNYQKRKLINYLSEEIELIKFGKKINEREHIEKYSNTLRGKEFEGKVFQLIDEYNKSNNEDFLDKLDSSDKHFLIKEMIISQNQNSTKFNLTNYGLFLSKFRLFKVFNRHNIVHNHRYWEL